MKRSLFAVAVAAVLLFLAAGCTHAVTPTATAALTPSPPATVPPSPTATATPSPSTATPSPDATATVPAIHSGALELAAPIAPDNLDVQQVSSPSLLLWGPGIAYSQLFQIVPGPGWATTTSVVECSLCSSWQQVDPTTYRVTLRNDVHWQNLPPLNGRLLTAQDVVYSYQRQATSTWANSGLLASLASVSAPDAHTVVLKLKYPNADFLLNLADGRSKIVAPEAVKVHGDLTKGPTVGTGPWILKDANSIWSKFTANPDYFKSQMPGVGSLTISYLSAGTVYSALVTHTVDMAELASNEIAQAHSDAPSLKDTSVLMPGAGLELAIKTDSGPFTTVAERQALLSQLNMPQQVTKIFGGDATTTVGLPVPSPAWELPAQTLRTYLQPPSDLASVKKQLAGTSVTVTVGDFGDSYSKFASAVADAASSLGMKAAVDLVTTRQFGDNVWFGGKYQIFVGAQPPVPSLNNYLFSVYDSKGEWNTTGYTDSKLDALIQQQAVELDPAKRIAQVHEIEKQILAGAYRLSPATRIVQWAYWPDLMDFYPNLNHNNSLWLARIRIENSK